MAESEPASCASLRAHSVREAFANYENPPDDTERRLLRVYVHDNCHKNRLRLGVNEFQVALNCLPMATVCSEARSIAATFCQTRLGTPDLIYAVDSSSCKTDDSTNEILEPVFAQQTTVMVTNASDKNDGPKGFDSAEHLIDVVSRVFGSVERIILTSRFLRMSSLEEIYWPHTAQILKQELL